MGEVLIRPVNALAVDVATLFDKEYIMSCSKEESLLQSIRTHLYLLLLVTVLPVLAHGADAEDRLDTGRNYYFSGNFEQAVEALSPVAHAGDAEAQYYLAMVYGSDQWDGTDYSTAVALLLSSADQQFPAAMWELGRAYEEGRGVEKDLMLAIDWYRRSEAAGSSTMPRIAFFKVDDEEMVQQAPEGAVADLRRKAESGNVDAQYQLAKIYDTGALVDVDRSKALEWYRRAADNGHGHSQLMVGYFYCRGIEVEMDTEMANAWIRRAGRDAVCRDH